MSSPSKLAVAGIGDPGREAGLIISSSSLASSLASTRNAVHKHLRWLERVWIDRPIYFMTTCTFRPRAILATNDVADILIDEWRNAHDRHGWAIGRYVIMPDHVHFFLSRRAGRQIASNFHAEMEAVDQ